MFGEDLALGSGHSRVYTHRSHALNVPQGPLGSASTSATLLLDDGGGGRWWSVRKGSVRVGSMKARSRSRNRGRFGEVKKRRLVTAQHLVHLVML